MNRNALTPTDGCDATLDHSRRTWMMTVAVAALTVPAAYYNGVIHFRWGDPAELPEHLAVLDRLPDHLGEWRFVAEGKATSDAVVRKLELRGQMHRVYEHSVTGQRVALLLLVGPAGPLVRHPPEVCYETRANDLLSSEPLAMDGEPNNLRLLSYRSDSLIDGDFLVAYGFGADRRWDVPASPRLAYGGQPVLYKLQVLTEAADETAEGRPEGLIDFLSNLLPMLAAGMPG
jgi:hypothetical protein